MARKNQEVTAPIMPKVQDYGLEEEDLKKVTIRDILLSEGLASVVMVLGTALSIWAYSWWGIALACIGLGVLYATRRVLSVVLKSELDASRLTFKAALNEYYISRHLYDAELDEIERQKVLDKASGELDKK
ncbi:MAG: hypothetical protein ACJZ2G_06960 [Thalassobaculaceae bacterium]|jgi:hypothetical protein|tara:strand:- start:516 stop:908 length:393 start_codon:yes stop_codon:yes gene_type:complete